MAEPEPTYHPMTSHAPITVTGSDGTVQHPGQSVREGVAGIGSTINHALAGVARGVGDAVGLHHNQPAVVVGNHNPNVNGDNAAHTCSSSTTFTSQAV